MPTSHPINADSSRAGFSLIEILVVLAIFALSAAVIMPSTSRMLDQATSHAVFFEFQKQVSDYRREANRTGVAIRLADPEAAKGDSPQAGGAPEGASDDWVDRTVTSGRHGVTRWLPLWTSPPAAAVRTPRPI